MISKQNELVQLFKSLSFAAYKHKDQTRKDPEATPYINHPIQVAELLVKTGKIDDIDILSAAILHDTIEDTETSENELMNIFGNTVSSYVIEMTDNKNLSKSERKRLQVINAPHKSYGAKLIKLSDKICNINDIINNPPADWNETRRIEYLNWALQVVNGLRGTNPAMEELFDKLFADGMKILEQ